MAEIRRGLAVWEQRPIKDEPAVHMRRVRELPEETRLAHPGLPDDGHELALSLPRRGQRLRKNSISS